MGLREYDQAFFLHIPKTAGRSFGRLLRRDAGLGPVLRIPPPGRGMIRALARAGEYSVVQGHVPYPVADLLRQPLLVITFLRHPVDRAMSLFEYAHRRSGWPLHKRIEEAGARTPADLMRHGIASNTQTAVLGATGDLRPAIEGFKAGKLSAREARRALQQVRKPRDRATLELAKRRLEKTQFIGITEAFDDSVRLFAEVVGARGGFTSYRINTAPAADRAAREARYGGDVLDAIAEANSLDLELYEFAVRLFRQRYEDAFGEPPTLNGPP